MAIAPEIVFNLAGGQNQFFVELAETLADGLRRIGVRAGVTADAYPEPTPDRVFVLLPPHEYLERSGFRPPEEFLGRCIGISAEQPTSVFFPHNVALAHHLGAVFDINPRATREYVRSGIAAQHLQLGYSPAWDRFERVERDIDVLFIGRMTARRDQALALCANTFEPMNVHLQLADGGRPSLLGRPDVVFGADKLELLARAKVLLTIHGEEEPYFEWLRVAEAISAGAVVVSEHSSDVLPLRHGEHLITGGIHRLGLLCAWLVENAAERDRIRGSAYTLLRDRYHVDDVATRLAAAAVDVDIRGPVTPRLFPGAQRGFIAARRAERPEFDFVPAESPHDAATGRALRTLKTQSLALLNLRRQFDQLAAGAGRPATAVIHETSGWARAPDRRLAIIVPVYNHRHDLFDALDSVIRSRAEDWELVVVDDASTDGSAEAVVAWMTERDAYPCRLVQHAINRGLPHARNTGLAHSSAPVMLMLDADNELRPGGAGRLMAALERDPEASFAYGIIERFSADGPVGLLSFFPWDPERLRAGNYIDALAAIRRSTFERVGTYSDDPRLALGWEDYDLWARVAESGGHGAFVAQFVARYRVGHSSMRAMTDISTTDAYAAVADHAPRLMHGVPIPD